MSSFQIKRNDTEPPLDMQLVAGGAPIVLTDCTVKFIMTPKGAATPKVARSATVQDEDTGVVRYAWQTGDTDTVGSFYAEWEITYPGGGKRTVPSSGYAYVEVTEDLG